MSAAQTWRLDRLLANLGYGSRREVQKLAASGLVTLHGVPVKKADQKITLEEDLPLHLRIDGEALDPLPGLVLMMNKPLGLSCSHKEEGEIVYELLPERWRRRSPAISTVGRLDKDTSGLLLLTDDGELLHRIQSPKKEIVKRYHATLERPLSGEEAALFASGTLMLHGEDKPLLPATLSASPSATEAVIAVSEGRYHQVRRMFAAVGNHVIALRRESIGALSLGDLAEGEYRILTHEELAQVFAGPNTLEKHRADS